MKTKEPEIITLNNGNSSIKYLYYHGQGPAVVLYHATGFNPWMWHPIALQLSLSNPVLVPFYCDNRSGDPYDGGVKWYDLAQDLCDMCALLDLKQPYMVGHSMGAAVMTIAGFLNPGYCRSMLLIEPIYLPEQIYGMERTVDAHPLASKSIKRKNSWKNRDDVESYLMSKKMFSSWDREMLELYIKHGFIESEDGNLRLACHPTKEAAYFMGSSYFNPWDHMAELECPVYLLEGAESGNKSFVDLKRAASEFPMGRFQSISGAGHMVPMEKPNEVVLLVRRFILENE